MNTIDIPSYLVDKGNEIKTSAGQIVAKICPFCSDEKWHFYIDPQKQIYFCHKCQTRGNEITLRRKFNDMGSDTMKSFQQLILPKNYKRPDPTIDEFYHQAIFKTPVALEFLKSRGINGESIQHFKLGYHVDKNEKAWITIPYYEDKKIANIKYRALPPAKKDFKRTKDAKSTLFNQDCIPECEELIITEGEFDTIMCWQAGYKNVVSVPNGCSNFEPGWIDMLQNLNKIYLWYDNDEAGNKFSDDLAERLGVERCFFVKPHGFKDANEYFLCHSEMDFSQAKPKRVENIIVFAESVFRIFEHEKDLFSEIKTPWDKVNRLIRNIEAGDLITLSATPKTGKTTLSLNIAVYNAKRGQPVLFYCLEMRPERLAKKVIESEGMIKSEEYSKEIVLAVAQRLGDIPLYFGYNFKKIDTNMVFQTIRNAVRRYGIKLIIFDNLHYLVRSLAHTTAEVGIITRKFKLLAEELRLPILLIAQPRKVEEGTVMTMNDLKDSSSIGADSDQVIILWRKKTKPNITNPDGQEASFEPKTLVRVDASRFTPGGDTILYFKGEISRFEELCDKK